MAQSTEVIWNPYHKGYFNNPHELLEAYREENPIHKGIHGAWMLFRYKEVSEILRSSKFTVSDLSNYLAEKEPYIFNKTNACPYLSKGTQKWTMYLDGEEHRNARIIMGRALKDLDLDLILQESTKKLNRKFQDKTDFDLVEYCAYFIFLVIEQIFGIKDYESFEQVKKYSNMLAKSQDVFIPKQIYQRINKWFLWGKKIFAESDYKNNLEQFSKELGVNYSEEEIYSMMSVSLMAAFETSKDNLAVALYEVLKDTELTDYVLNANAKELNLAIEELFRFTAPLQYTVRVSKEPLTIEDISIPTGSKLYLCLASANRDPRVFENPNTIIPNRTPNNHLAFGCGTHHCLGATIARREMRFCMKPMVAFLKNYQVKKDSKIKWAKQIFMRTVHSIPLEQVTK